jgi:ABC-type spermidine/putrescine transport system permease subunit II
MPSTQRKERIMQASLIIGSVVVVIVLATGMITAFALQTSERRIDSPEPTRKACSMPLERIENPI